MDKKIKNVHDELITLFVKKNGVETKVDIPPGNSMIVDDYETPTLRVFKKKNLITMEPAQIMEEDSLAWTPGDMEQSEDRAHRAATIDDTVDSNNDETMDHFHTTETHEVVEKDDLESFKENLSKALTNKENSSKLEIVEDEVEQYIEEGYIKGEWTDEEIELLKREYPTKGRKHCASTLNRNESSVQKKINSLGLKKKKKRNKKRRK